MVVKSTGIKTVGHRDMGGGELLAQPPRGHDIIWSSAHWDPVSQVVALPSGHRLEAFSLSRVGKGLVRSC